MVSMFHRVCFTLNPILTDGFQITEAIGAEVRESSTLIQNMVDLKLPLALFNLI